MMKIIKSTDLLINIIYCNGWMFIVYPKLVIAYKKHAVSNKPPCKVQNILISPLPSNKPPSNKPPCQNLKLTISPRWLNRGFTVVVFSTHGHFGTAYWLKINIPWSKPLKNRIWSKIKSLDSFSLIFSHNTYIVNTNM